MKIKLSKSQWEKAGQEAGWMKTAMFNPDQDYYTVAAPERADIIKGYIEQIKEIKNIFRTGKMFRPVEEKIEAILDEAIQKIEAMDPQAFQNTKQDFNDVISSLGHGDE